MSSLSKQEQLAQLIADQQELIRQTFPTNRGSAVVALTRARDWHYLTVLATFQGATGPVNYYQGDRKGSLLLYTLNEQNRYHSIVGAIPCGRPGSSHYPLSNNSYLCSSGWQKALQLCFGNATVSPSVFPPATDSTLDTWADQTLRECNYLSEAEQVLAHCETGFMRMQQGGQKDFSVWIDSKKMPTEWREREDIAWWTNALAQTYERETQELALENVSIQQQLAAFASEWQTGETVYNTTPEIDDHYLRLGRLHVNSMTCHFLYPPQTFIGDCTIELYSNVLALLIGLALKYLDLCKAFIKQHPLHLLRALLAPPQTVDALIAALSKTLGVERTAIHRVVDAYSLSHENVSYHCSLAGVPAPPLLRLNEQQLVWSLTGLLSEPFFFLTRELKRRYSYEYHTASHQHEAIFRQDLYSLFSDKRFVRSTGSVELRGVQGDLTTDVDALIFDRKTGTLALFELKSQDPFAYSRQERIRQRDYFYNAGKQVLASIQWLNRNGANTLLTRLDANLVKRLKVQKTYIFVLGRYLAHFFDGPEFDRRAAWGTWPQVLRLINETPFAAEDTNPIQSLYNKLLKDTPLTPPTPILAVQEIPLGESKLYVYPDFKTYKNQVG